jgi:diguanylate cyclase (GGDEF)-like protein
VRLFAAGVARQRRVPVLGVRSGYGELAVGSRFPGDPLSDKAADEPGQAGDERDVAAERRDQAGDERDRAGDERDRAGERRDLAADRRDRHAEHAEHAEASVGAVIPPDVLSRSASSRREAAADRSHASRDRGAGASERTEAELDRSTALADRSASAKERERSSHDGLTGAYLRGPGAVELEREIARARRTERPLSLAFVDVDGLKAISDLRGHAAGDRVLVSVADALRATLRSHDLVIRYGGDEFACVIEGLNAADTTKRLAGVNAVLAVAADPASVTLGVTQLRPTDSTDDLLGRADAALYRERPERPQTAR